MLQPTSVSAAVTTSLVKHVSYVSTAKNEPGYDICADKVQQSFYRTGCMLYKKNASVGQSSRQKGGFH
ncbi:hypothetical protein IAQ67_08940 [Paenibacillus peoriae]|uniref:Uncharacterized protein n=1 Tax=Paenibacillus peoriae TaxID=59893 RepID=A0A7H0YDG1_9BACL|nr:hypothetical protein AM598_23770 [Paenibacillus polymyxa]PNQ81418.1 hypothetical protein C1T21_08975 [Paenibacillus sp. F4]QNR69119.1 hypothetical protein IAQ67_08940 [Paenibacillus peoriae]